MFPVISVDNTKAEVMLEPLGTKRKFWFHDDKGRQMLFKAEERGTGEDWAEKIACELCKLLGLPHVHYDLAEEVEGKTPGVVCETCAKPPLALVLGNQLLLDHDPAYPVIDARRYKVRQHTVEAVTEIVQTLQPPPSDYTASLPDGIATALDVFVGYIMLDAWIANQDRHHENWAALREGEQFFLAPSFDHGASMARNISDTEREKRLTTRDVNFRVAAFARRAKSAFYRADGPDKTITTVEAWRLFSRKSPQSAIMWKQRLEAIDEQSVDHLLGQVPTTRLSSVGRDFTRQLLCENRRRLLEGDEP